MAAAAAYAALVPQTTPQRASALINPAEGLTYSSALAERSTGHSLKQLTITEKGVSVTSAFNTALSTEDSDAPFVSAGLAARNDSAGLLAGGSGQQSDVLATSLASDEAFKAQDPGGSADELSPLQLTRYGCDEISEKYCVYEVQPGDTLGQIASNFGLESTEDFENWKLLVYSNQQVVVDPDAVIPGQKLIIPRGQGVIHTVLGAETLFDLADRYGVDIEAIMSANGMTNADLIGIGSELLIPNPTRLVPPATGDGGLAGPVIVGGGDSSGFGFIWPVGGPISSYFTPGHPLGIDIDLYSNEGAPIAAAKGGTVSFAGGNPCCSYGNYVVVDHGDGFQTLYAHLSGIAVSQGQYVESGQLVGYGGSTGYSTGTHLHFEVHYGGSIVDPLAYLP
ncbi:MAG TPA: peptidoglycan DD-metalloendopeptidase family protein [Dehalococcoidia bacterium]|nr:peptidoglycan DD-metalloendopeptidase family protein [Dehalococcoidia bacterium]